MRRPQFILVLTLAIVVITRHVCAQCPGHWLPGGGVPGLDGTARTLLSWDSDGPGPCPPVLITGGTFALAGRVAASNVAAWDGQNWSSLGSGTDGEVEALATLPNGNLVVAGLFNHAGGVAALNIARWDGQAWYALGGGLNGQVHALLVMPNGDLVAGGSFVLANG